MDNRQADLKPDVPQVLRRHRDAIWRLVAYFATDADETLDLVEDLFARALLHGEGCRSESAFTT